MASRKVVVELTVKLELVINDKNTDSSEVVDELDWNFTDTTGKATVTDMYLAHKEELSSTKI